MNPFARWRTDRIAREDARLGVDAKERRMVADLGLSPAEERDTFEQRRAIADAAATSDIEELREDVRRAEDLTVIVGSPAPYTLAAVVAALTEFAGAVLVLRSIGVPAAHRVLPALALTTALIALTRALAQASAKATSTRADTPVSNTTEGEGGTDPPRPAGYGRVYALACVWALIVLATTVVRLFGSNADEVPFAALCGEAVLTAVISVGPAFLAAWAESKRAPAVELARRLAVLRRRLRAAEARVRRGETYLRDRDRRLARWTDENARRRAVYATAHELARVEAVLEPDDSDLNPNNSAANDPTAPVSKR